MFLPRPKCRCFASMMRSLFFTLYENSDALIRSNVFSQTEVKTAAKCLAAWLPLRGACSLLRNAASHFFIFCKALLFIVATQRLFTFRSPFFVNHALTVSLKLFLNNNIETRLVDLDYYM